MSVKNYLSWPETAGSELEGFQALGYNTSTFKEDLNPPSPPNHQVGLMASNICKYPLLCQGTLLDLWKKKQAGLAQW